MTSSFSFCNSFASIASAMTFVYIVASSTFSLPSSASKSGASGTAKFSSLSAKVSAARTTSESETVTDMVYRLLDLEIFYSRSRYKSVIVTAYRLNISHFICRSHSSSHSRKLCYWPSKIDSS